MCVSKEGKRGCSRQHNIQMPTAYLCHPWMRELDGDESYTRQRLQLLITFRGVSRYSPVRS